MRIVNKCALLSLLVLFTVASAVRAQCPPVYTFTGEAAGDSFGQSVSGAGNVNGDGFADLIVGASANDDGALVPGGLMSIHVRSPAATLTITGVSTLPT